MLAILNYLDTHNFPILQPILMILLSYFMVYGAISDKTYLSLGLLSPLIFEITKRFAKKAIKCNAKPQTLSIYLK